MFDGKYDKVNGLEEYSLLSFFSPKTHFFDLGSMRGML